VEQATEVSGPPCHHHLLRGKQLPRQCLITTPPMARTMFLLLLSSPIIAQGAPHPQSALPQKSCGCVSEEEKRTLSPTPSNLTMADCGKTCSASPFFAFSAPAHTDLDHHLQSETDIRSSVGSCLCSTTKSSSPTPCSENKNVPVFCTVSLPGGHNQTDEGERADYSMMALVLLSIAITVIGLTGARAVWQARRRRLRLAKEWQSQKQSALATAIAIGQKVIASKQSSGVLPEKIILGKERSQDDDIVRDEHSIEEASERNL